MSYRPVGTVTADLLAFAAASEARHPSARELDWLTRVNDALAEAGWRAVTTDSDAALEWVPPGHAHSQDPTRNGWASLSYIYGSGRFVLNVWHRMEGDPDGDFEDVTVRTIPQLRRALREAAK